MPLDTAFLIAQELLKLNAIVLLGLVFVFAFIAYKVFAFILRILMTGLAFASFPFIANFIGIGIPITMQTILWSALAGILTYFLYMSISFGYRILNLAFSPFKRSFEHKKVKKRVRKEIEKERKGSKH